MTESALRLTSSRRRFLRISGIVAAAAATPTALSSCGTFLPSQEGPDEAVSGGAVTLYTTPEQNRGLEKLYGPFKEKTGIEMKANFAAADVLNQQLRIQVTSGTASDMFRSPPGFSTPSALGPLSAEGALLDLSGSAWAERVPEALHPLIKFDGKLVALPVGRQAIVMFYNKDVMSAASVEIPKTWPEFVACCKAIKAAGKIPLSLPLGFAAAMQFLPYAMSATLVGSREPDIYQGDPKGQRPFSKSAGWKEIFTKFFGLITAGYTNENPVGMTLDPSLQMVAKGDAAMTCLISQNYGNLAKYFSDTTRIGVFAVPPSDNAADTWVPATPDVLSINAKARNADGARAFLDFLAEPANMDTFNDVSGLFGGLSGESTIDNLLTREIGPYLDAGKTAVFPSHAFPNGQVQQVIMQSGQSVVTGSKTIDQLLADMDDAYAQGRP